MFRPLLIHILKEFKENEMVIREGCPEFAESVDAFQKEIDEEIRKNHINIDHYMRDLRKHALIEYNDLYIEE